MVYCCNLATFGSPLTVCMPPAACQVDPEVSSARSISSTSFQPILVKWYSTLAPTTPPPITTAWAWLFMRSLIGYRQMAAVERAARFQRQPAAIDGCLAHDFIKVPRIWCSQWRAFDPQ